MIKFKVALWQNGEFAAFVKGLFSRQALPKLQQLLEKRYQRQILLLNSARSGIRIALRYAATQQPQRHLVLYPEYICSSVPQAITEAGFTGRAIAVTTELNMCPQALAAQMVDQPLAVILPHMYGAAASIVEIETLCRQHQVLLIDDAAQVAGVEADNRLLGTFGDFGVISFAQAKTIVTGVQGSGGVLIYPESVQLNMELKPTSGWRRLGPLWHFLGELSAGWLDQYIRLLCAAVTVAVAQKLSLKSTSPYADGFEISAPDAAIALKQFETLSDRIHTLRQQATIANTTLADLAHLQFPQLQPGRYLTRLIVRSEKLAPAELAQACLKLGIHTKTTYGSSSKSFDGSLTSGLLELPWQGLKADELSAMLSKLKTLDQRIGSGPV